MNGMSSGPVPARTSAYRRIRLAVVAASVVAAIVGSVLLATHRSSGKVSVQRGSIPAPARVAATIRVGPKRACCAERMRLIASPRDVWVAVPSGNRLVRIDPATNRVAGVAALDYEPCGYLAADRIGGVWSAACGVDV